MNAALESSDCGEVIGDGRGDVDVAIDDEGGLGTGSIDGDALDGDAEPLVVVVVAGIVEILAGRSTFG